MSNMSYKPIDGAKEDFRRYLDRKGVMDTLTKAFIACYDDRPENPIERLLEVISETSKHLPSNYRTKLDRTEQQLAEAEKEIKALRSQLEGLGVKPEDMAKPPSTVSAMVPTPTTPAISAISAEKSPEPATAAAAAQDESVSVAMPAAAIVTPSPAAVAASVPAGENEESAKTAVKNATASPAKVAAVSTAETPEVPAVAATPAAVAEDNADDQVQT